jgi:pSer/pThr/pTyr-binding forkhead associated (FHA) protein
VGRNGRFFLQDLGSTNGTTVDGKRVQEVQLQAGSEIAIGTTRMLVFETEDEVGDAPDTGVAGIAWLLEEDLSPDAPGDDLVGQSLRLPPRFEGRIEAIAGPDQGKVWRMTRGSLTVGRKQGEIPLSDSEISRRHLFIEVFGPDMVFVRDVASTNGTYHNGRRVSVARLSPGDAIGCGKSVLRYYSS